MTVIPILDLLKSTTDGRFRVTIESFRTGDGDAITVEDACQSLNELSSILADASKMTTELSCRLLDEAAAAATDPRRM